MSDYYQGSLLDVGAAPALGQLAPRRTVLGDGAWVDVQPGWVGASDDLFLRLESEVAWQAERREMYDRVVDVPRLLCHFGRGDELPDPLLLEAREQLSDHYQRELGERFATAGLCLYRDGRDSVAWHGDRIGRGRSDDTMVAIVSVGAARRLSLRPRGGGRQVGFALGHGDLVVMGGSCQRTWDHAILKTARPVGPRISIQFRPRGVL
ncbi:MAG: alpha-ketoglutarate-dependent dioxygenase AlkB [Aeromicrobium sp.]